MNAQKEAFLARQAGGPEMRDGLIVTPGLPEDQGEVEVAEEPPEFQQPQGVEETGEAGEDTLEAYADMTVSQLKELADSREIDYPSDIHKADLVELLASV